MQKLVFVMLAIVTVAAILVPACRQGVAKEGKSEEAITSNIDLVKRGGYLVNAMLCDDCHSPKSMGPNGPEIIQERRLSGYTSGNKLPDFDSTEIKKGWVIFSPDFTGIVGPWGASFAANITSDPTGIGSWNYEQFKKAFMGGKLKGLNGTRDLLPPMPWQNFSKLDDRDVQAIYAFLKSTRPVRNVVPTPKKFSELY
jgi:hypothetical protein